MGVLNHKRRLVMLQADMVSTACTSMRLKQAQACVGEHRAGDFAVRCSTPVGCKVQLAQAAGQSCNLAVTTRGSLLHLQADNEVAAQVEVLQAGQRAQAAELRNAIASEI